VQEIVRRYAGEVERVHRSMSGDQLLRMLGDTIARVGATAHVRPVYAALLPYAGLLNVGGGQCAGLPVDDVLGRLAALAGDVRAAVDHARDAVAVARAMPSPPMLVAASTTSPTPSTGRAATMPLIPTSSAWRPQRSPSRSASPAPVGRARRSSRPRGRRGCGATGRCGCSLHRWAVPGFPTASVSFSSPGCWTSPAPRCLPLSWQATSVRRPPTSGPLSTPGPSGPQRLRELQAEVDDAAACNDPVRGERAHVEIEALLRELKRATGLGVRDRLTGSDAERASVNVVRSLRRAIAAITQQADGLGAHLEVSVRTGRCCGYLPEPAAALSWTVES
jgi:hypothetical protein